MKATLDLQRALTAFLITGISVFVLVPAHAAVAPEVTANNYVRAETDVQMKGYIASYDSFGKLAHFREPYDVDNQVTVSGNRDTLYSVGVFDLQSPLTVTPPETGGRYQSLMIVSQDHSIWSFYGPRTGALTEEKVGTRYVFLAIRTFMDPNDEKDMKAAHRLQDAIRFEQADIANFEVPDWNKEEVEQMRDTIRVVASTVRDLSRMFGKKENLAPVYRMPVNKYNAYSFNNVTAKKAKDGSVTIHFGGDPEADNFLPIVPGWNYIVRMYKPGPEILDGSWTFPSPQAVE